MALITNYSTLQSAISDWLARADLTGVIPTFIQLAESRLNRDVKSPRNLQVIAGTLASHYFDFPILFLEQEGKFKEIKKLSITYGGRDYVLAPLTPNEATDIDVAGPPRGYYVLGATVYVIGGNGDENYSLVAEMSLPDISSAVNSYTNWVLQKAPELYLYASLLEASPYLKADSRIGIWAEGYRVALQSLNEQEERLVRGPGMRIKPVRYAP